jgi:hypothetical protein
MEQATINRNDDEYFNLMNAYLLVQVAELDNTLKENGITDLAARRKICAEFGLSMGEILDSGWIAANGKRYYPLLMFAEKFLDGPETALSSLGEIEGPPKTDEFHPLAVDAAMVFFDELNGDCDKVEYGSVGED